LLFAPAFRITLCGHTVRTGSVSLCATTTCKASAIAFRLHRGRWFRPASPRPQIARSRTLGTTSGFLRTRPTRPFTAEYKITPGAKLCPTETTITRDSTELKARDSQGPPILPKTTIPSPSGDQAPTTIFNVFDPVARTMDDVE
jgi:hypothetical protein